LGEGGGFGGEAGVAEEGGEGVAGGVPERPAGDVQFLKQGEGAAEPADRFPGTALGGEGLGEEAGETGAVEVLAAAGFEGPECGRKVRGGRAGVAESDLNFAE
jgi:hypothetical protein